MREWAEPVTVTVIDDEGNIVRFRDVATYGRNEGEVTVQDNGGAVIASYLPGEWKGVGLMEWADDTLD